MVTKQIESYPKDLNRFCAYKASTEDIAMCKLFFKGMEAFYFIHALKNTAFDWYKIKRARK